ncbi:hypothetical protein V8G54_006652 [Vigna mungo]|uniref:Uncharacterized protein n=1 Tax=Vigna mungo TaxID=3915 RepID=A0AAQ3P1U4_VIGMU
MPILTSRDWRWKHNPSCISRLPNIFQMNPPSHLLDHNRRKPLRPELLMNTQEIDLSHLHNLLINSDPCWYATNESNQLLRGLGTHTNVPTPVIPRNAQRPPEKLLGIVEPEHVFIILNIVILQQNINLITGFRRVHVTCGPFISTRKVIRLLLNLRQRCGGLNGAFSQTCVPNILVLSNRLCFPELMPLTKSH